MTTSRETLLFGVTTSTCETCRALVPAKIVADGDDVLFRKFCPDHGEHVTPVRKNPSDYLQTLRYVKPAWMPDRFSGDAAKGCPDGCGFCQEHEQHLCMPIIEITNRCNLLCPVCLNSSGAAPDSTFAPDDLSVDEFRLMLDRLIQAEKQVDVLNLSGGEPLLHPEIIALVDEALSRAQIIRVSISTNGLQLLSAPGLLEALRQRNIVISLQFDGFDDTAYETLRGRTLLAEKLEILRCLKAADVTTSLTMTMAHGVNTAGVPEVLQLLFSEKHIVSLMIQPVAFSGRGSTFAATTPRISIPEVVQLLGEAGHPAVAARDFAPLPCSHPLCFSLAFYLMLDNGGTASVNSLVNASVMMDSLSNRVFFGLDPEEHRKARDMIYDLWSGPVGAIPSGEAVLQTLRGLLKALSDRSRGGGFDARRTFTVAERQVKSIFIHAFQDAGTFDLDRTRRCCQAYPQKDGRLLPACVRNVLHPKADQAASCGVPR